jgi:GNAT superfamily N-acetyltransferase
MFHKNLFLKRFSSSKDIGEHIYSSYKIEKYPSGYLDKLDGYFYVESVVKDISTAIDDMDADDYFASIGAYAYDENRKLIAKAEFSILDVYAYGSLETVHIRADNLTENLGLLVASLDECEIRKDTIDNEIDTLSVLTLDSFAVKDEYQRKGIGTLLVKTAMELYLQSYKFNYLSADSILCAYVSDEDELVELDCDYIGDSKSVKADDGEECSKVGILGRDVLAGVLERILVSCESDIVGASDGTDDNSTKRPKCVKMKDEQCLGWWM